MSSSAGLLSWSPYPLQTSFCDPIIVAASSPCRPGPAVCMAFAPTPAGAQRSSLDHLSTELIALFCEWLRQVHYPSLMTLRSVSRRFNSIATPIAYRTLPLSRALVEPGAELRYPGAFTHISSHTRHVIVRSTLSPAGTRHVLSKVKRLSSLRWQFSPLELGTTHPFSLVEILDPEQARTMETRIYIDGLPLRDFTKRQADTFLESIPPSCLASLILTTPALSLIARLDSLRRLLVQSNTLETFRYDDRGQGTSFSFQEGERTSAVRNLTLNCYDWDHSAEDVRSHWDFSRIESLRLISIPTINFLNSTSFNDFSRLHTLQVDDYSAHLPDRRLDATRGLYTLVREHIRALQVLDISCHTRHFPLDAIMQHRHSLQVLRFRDHVGFSDENRRCPTMAPSDLAQLASRLVHVHQLEIDMDVQMCDPLAFLQALGNFRNLTVLTLRVQTLLTSDDTPSQSDDDFGAAMQAFRFLVNLREQRAPNFPWKRVTINVGEWKRYTARRVSTAWRVRNEKGVFAERCFVMERNESKRYSVWEEGTGRTYSPDL